MPTHAPSDAAFSGGAGRLVVQLSMRTVDGRHCVEQRQSHGSWADVEALRGMLQVLAPVASDGPAGSTAGGAATTGTGVVAGSGAGAGAGAGSGDIGRVCTADGAGDDDRDAADALTKPTVVLEADRVAQALRGEGA